jgi:hypothetical protein
VAQTVNVADCFPNKILKMRKIAHMNTTLNTAIGSSAVTFPAWSMYLDHGWAVFIALLGALVLLTTLWKNIEDLKIKRKQKALLENELENLK